MDELLDNPAGWRFQEVMSMDYSIFLWLLGAAYLLVIAGLVVRMLLGRRTKRSETKIGQSFSTYKRERASKRRDWNEVFK